MAFPDLPFTDEPASTPTTLREPGRYHCRCTYIHPGAAALWQSIDGAGSVWIPREEGVNLSVGTEAYISITGSGRALLWIFPKRNDFHHAVHPVDEGFVSFVPKPVVPAREYPPF